MYRGQQLRPLALGSPLYNIPNAAIREVTFRIRTQLSLQDSAPKLKAVLFDDRPGIIYSNLDVTGGLVGYECYAVDGYSPASAFAILRNVVLFGGR